VKPEWKSWASSHIPYFTSFSSPTERLGEEKDVDIWFMKVYVANMKCQHRSIKLISGSIANKMKTLWQRTRRTPISCPSLPGKTTTFMRSAAAEEFPAMTASTCADPSAMDGFTLEPVRIQIS
jgi:hypothetical protein